MFTEPTITWVPLGFSGYIWLDTKIVLNNSSMIIQYIFLSQMVQHIVSLWPSIVYPPRKLNGYLGCLTTIASSACNQVGIHILFKGRAMA